MKLKEAAPVDVGTDNMLSMESLIIERSCTYVIYAGTNYVPLLLVLGTTDDSSFLLWQDRTLYHLCQCTSTADNS